MFNTVLLIVAAGMAAWNVYRLITRPDSVAVVTVLFWAVLLWRILSPLDWHISVLAGLLLLKVILAQRRHARMQGDAALGRRLQEASQRGSEPATGRSIHPMENREMDEDENDEEENAEEDDDVLEEKESVTLATTPVGRPLSVRFATTEGQTLPTTSGQPLQIAPGEHSGMLALHEPPREEIKEAMQGCGTPRLKAEFTYVAPDGSRWRGEERLWLDTILSLERIADSEDRPEVRFWHDASPEMQRVFSERCMVAKFPAAEDGRVRFPLTIGTRRRVIMTKYLAWKVDLALDPDERRMWVRVSELQEEVWEGDVFGPDSDSAEWEDYKRIPAFYYALSVEEFLPRLKKKSIQGFSGELESREAQEEDTLTVFTPVET